MYVPPPPRTLADRGREGGEPPAPALPLPQSKSRPAQLPKHTPPLAPPLPPSPPRAAPAELGRLQPGRLLHPPLPTPPSRALPADVGRIGGCTSSSAFHTDTALPPPPLPPPGDLDLPGEWLLARAASLAALLGAEEGRGGLPPSLRLAWCAVAGRASGGWYRGDGRCGGGSRAECTIALPLPPPCSPCTAKAPHVTPGTESSVAGGRGGAVEAAGMQPPGSRSGT